MSIYSDTHSTPHYSGLAYAVAGIAVERVRQVLRFFKNRRDAFALAGLDDRMLADIGLTRGDVRDAFSEPVWRDPTAVLVSRARERRVNRRRVVVSQSAGDTPSIVPSWPPHVAVNRIG